MSPNKWPKGFCHLQMKMYDSTFLPVQVALWALWEVIFPPQISQLHSVFISASKKEKHLQRVKDMSLEDE